MGVSATRSCKDSSQEVQVKLIKESASVPYGLRLGRDAAGVVARGVDEGSVMAQWNRNNPQLDVRCGDRILKVNGVTAAATWDEWCRILEELRKTSVTLVVERQVKRPSVASNPTTDPTDCVLPVDLMEQLEQDLDVACCGNECAICLEGFTDKRAIVLPCAHAFHRGCVEQWFARCPTFQHASCPLCRGSLPPHVLRNTGDKKHAPEAGDN